MEEAITKTPDYYNSSEYIVYKKIENNQNSRSA